MDDTLTYTVTVINIGGETDNYDLTSSDPQGWATYLDNDNFVSVPSGENRTTTLNVALSTTGTHTVTVTATSQGDSSVSDSVSCEATSNDPHYGHLIGESDVVLELAIMSVAAAFYVPIVLMARKRKTEGGA